MLEVATHISYIIVHNIAKSNKAFCDGEFVKQCMLQVCDVLCPYVRKDFETLSLSRKTITSKAETINNSLTSQLILKINLLKSCSIAIDENTDINDTAQLILFIRGVDEYFEISDELACIRYLQRNTMGCDIFREFSEDISILKVPIENICNITTDEAANMTGKRSGFSGLFNQNYACDNVVFLHCLIHQYVLYKSALNIKYLLDVVVKLVNTIRSRGIIHRKFQDFLHTIKLEYSNVFYYTKVSCLSVGRVFERVWNLKDAIASFLREKTRFLDFEMLEDFAFFTDLICHINNLII